MDIDFVVLWVDGNDPEWQKEKAKFQTERKDDSNSINRFRDWGLMPYWFRAVEKYCPWVRTVHFVTCGHVPFWMDLDCPKLNHVKHSDYIPERYLPTFNANTIEMNLHRIPGLADRFVFFNDDMFVLKPMSEEDFFREGLPCTFGGEVPFQITGDAGIWQHLILNDLRVLNNHFNKGNQVRKYRKKYINQAYRWQDNIRTMALEKLYPEVYLGFKNLHAPAAFLKKTFEEIWSKEPGLLERTSSHRFRTNEDVNQWLALWWQIAEGSFSPYMTDSLVEDIGEDTVEKLSAVIRGGKHDMVCLNDSAQIKDFEKLSGLLRDAFETILPEKSCFEK